MKNPASAGFFYWNAGTPPWEGWLERSDRRGGQYGLSIVNCSNVI